MEQTLGKRIAGYRKKLGLTQDQLAERLGVTAQAVSKWENDQSCPDITMLPKLAEIFSTSTDVLLGVAPEEPVHEATVMEADHEDAAQKDGPTWEFKYDNSRRVGIGFAIGVMLVGGLYLAVSLLKLEIGLWDIIWPTALLVFGVAGFIPFRSFSILRLACILIGGFFLVNDFVPVQIQMDNGVVIACIILLIGGGLLMDALKKPRKSRNPFSMINGEVSGNPRAEFSIHDGKLQFEAAFGDRNQKVTAPLLRSGMVNTSFGDYEIDLSGVEEVAPECRLEVNTSFGDLTIWVPSRFEVCCSSSTAFADMEINGKPDAIPAGTIQLIASVSFGQITVEYI